MATVFFTDIVDSTSLAARLGDQRWRETLSLFHRVVGRQVRRAGGRQVDSAGDGVFAVFSSPAEAIRCAMATTDELHSSGIEVRSGLHAGEVEFMGQKVGGIAVHLGARVCAEAGPGEILLTSTARELVEGSDIQSVDRGMRALKGIRTEWRIYAVVRDDAVPLDASALDAFTARAASGARRRWLRWAIPAAVVAVVLVVLAIVVWLPGGARPPATVLPGGGTVARIDAHVGEFTAAVPTSSTPTDVAVGGGFVWAIDYTSRTLVRIDPAAGTANPSGVEGTPTGLAFGGGRPWITTEFGSTSGSRGSVIRFNPSTATPDKVIPVGDGVEGIAYEASSVWVTNQLENTVVRIDATSGNVIATIDLPSRPVAIASGEGTVWVGSEDKMLSRIDTSANKLSQHFQLRARPTAIAVGDGAVWVALGSVNSLTRIDPTTGGDVTTIPVDGAPSGVAVVNDAVWVTSLRQQLVDRVDPKTGKVVSRVRVAGYPRGAAAMGADVWVAVSKTP